MPHKPDRLLHDAFMRHAEQTPDKIALITDGRRYSYGETLAAATQLAAALQAAGVGRGDRVVVYMENSWWCAVSIYAALLAGGVFVVINPQTKAGKLGYILRDSGAAALLCDAALAPNFLPALATADTLKLVACRGSLTGPQRKQTTKRVEALARLVANAPTLRPVPAIPLDLAALIYTSGSTGNPKGVMQTHQSMVFAAGSLIEYLRLDCDDRILCALPLAFDYGLYQLLMAMSLGATLVLERSFTYPAQVLARVAEEEVTVFPGVPTMFAMLIAAHRRSPLRFERVGRVTNTAAALPGDYLPALREIFPNALIYRMYGLTECKRVSYLEPELIERKPDSVGKAIPGTEVFLLSPDGEPVAPGELGILHVRGPHVMLGYWNQPELSARMLKPGPLPGERILCTQDWFRMDHEGFLYFVGRSDDIIKTKGEKVSPVEVENVLHGIDGVREAAVVGVPDPLLGEAIVAYLAPEPDAELDIGEIKRVCAARLENFMLPKRIVIVPELPKTTTGKISKKSLISGVPLSESGDTAHTSALRVPLDCPDGDHAAAVPADTNNQYRESIMSAAVAVPFSADVLQIDLAAEAERIAEGLREALRDVLHRRGFVVAVSGGIDSAVSAALAVRAVGNERVLGLLLPEHDSSSESVRLGRQVCESLGIGYVVEDIGPALEAIGCYRWRDQAIREVFPDFGDRPGWRCKLAIAGGAQGRFNHFKLIVATPEGEIREQRLGLKAYLQIVAATNFKQRIRKTMEYFHADRLNYAVVGTPNRLEYDQGFFVKNGDGSADVKPIAHLYKTQVYAMARHLGLPEEVCRAKPTTDTYSLPQGQDEFYFALPYQQMDIALWAYEHDVPAEQLAAVLGMSAEQARFVYQDIEAKRRATRYLHLAPVLLDQSPQPRRAALA